MKPTQFDAKSVQFNAVDKLLSISLDQLRTATAITRDLLTFGAIFRTQKSTNKRNLYTPND